ncbi:MAG: magnesium transporter [Halofilum sp. (in: g-proteobacteria)]|nr:magnesium transporter [Halofilum sp. (in: g-proteobacteria)]
MHAVTAGHALTARYLREYPGEAARTLEHMAPAEAIASLASHSVHVLRPVWERLSPFAAERLLGALPAAQASALLAELEPAVASALLSQMEPERRAGWLESLDPAIAAELRELLEYPPDCAGRLMAPRLGFFRGEMTVAEASERLRALRVYDSHSLFLVDDDQAPQARVTIQALALADLETPLADLAEPLGPRVDALSPREELVELLGHSRFTDLPVVDAAGRLIGTVPESGLLAAVQADAAGDMQAMVGASRDERALSAFGFAVRKRLPWLQINLLTAFLAASVVGLFEHTIAQYTALAVLLPVVAGQSGNAGAQALAVTMRGLALREITARHSLRVVLKELRVGLINGLAVAATTALGVYVWSGSWGLSLVISISMVLSMVAAGLAGALVPIVLQRMGQDPATASSIILTTVTDVAGFFSFLGIATMFAVLL